MIALVERWAPRVAALGIAVLCVGAVGMAARGSSALVILGAGLVWAATIASELVEPLRERAVDD